MCSPPRLGEAGDRWWPALYLYWCCWEIRYLHPPAFVPQAGLHGKKKSSRPHHLLQKNGDYFRFDEEQLDTRVMEEKKQGRDPGWL